MDFNFKSLFWITLLCCSANFVCAGIAIDTHEKLFEVSGNFLSVAIDTSFIFKHDLRMYL